MLLQLTLSGIVNGSIYALIALCITILLRTTTLINFSQGNFAMVAAYLTFVGIQLHVPYLAAALLAILILFGLGALIEKRLLRPLERQSHLTNTLMIVAVSYFFRGVVRFFYGRDVLPLPSLIDGEPIELGDAVLFPQEFVLISGALMIFITFFAIFEGTRVGKIIQAAAQTPRGAALVGINVPRFQALMWGFIAAIGALVGVLIAPVSLLYPDMGAKILTKAFAAMTLGGFGSLPGAIIGGLILGILENLVAGYIGNSLTDIAAFLVIIFVLLLFPRGIFGQWKSTRV